MHLIFVRQIGTLLHVKMSLISQSVLLNERKGNKLDTEVADAVVDDEVQEVDLIEEIKLKKSKKRSVKTDDFSQKKKKKSKNSIDMDVSLNEKAQEIEQEKMKRRQSKNASKEKAQKDAEEKMKSLESSLFGVIYNPLEFGKEFNADGKKQVKADAPLFFMDKSTSNEMIVYEEELHAMAAEDTNKEERKPAWIDEEEERTEVNIIRMNRLRKLRKEANEQVISGTDYISRLRAQHAKLNPGTEWANVDGKNAHESDFDEDSYDESGVTIAHGYEDAEANDFLRSNDDLVIKSNTKLLPGLLEYSRMVNANAEEPSNGPINSVQFHRNGQLLLTAGLDRRIRFFQVDGKRNPQIQSIFIEDCPVHKASFLPNGSEVILSGRRKFFYSIDLVKAAASKIGPLTGREEKSLEAFEVSPDSNTIAFIGNEGYILLVSSRTKELIGTLKMNGSARCLAFADGGQQLLSGGGDGHVYHWDLRTRRCIHKGTDDGSIGGSALCASQDSSMFASGSASGIVNVYKREEFLGGKQKPLKTIENLTTMVDHMKFNHDSQILAMISRVSKNGLKLVHIPSYNVFSNYPPTRSSIQYPRCLDFSPGGGFMTVGNAAGKVFLYKLHHYQNA
ncbi:U3 small nucleolar RNA-associated protein 18 homolog isoform X1 [Zingiber officinale]|uniref:U3 small nucleolar RNA-associated protein 18 homolog isoform X1 n=1 Tax=Zingiber officinale TaxID=94328 RepID=UPI001C4CB43B|nr:U3 small nucleolar RNA-associated protein 18 homolog isoform X1 [Zingiber officinale]